MQFTCTERSDNHVFFSEEGGEHYFPVWRAAVLSLTDDQLDCLLHLMTAAEVVGRAFGSVVTISSNHDIAFAMNVRIDVNNDESFRIGWRELVIRVTRGGVCEVQWRAVDDGAPERAIATPMLDRAAILHMRATGEMPDA